MAQKLEDGTEEEVLEEFGRFLLMEKEGVHSERTVNRHKEVIEEFLSTCGRDPAKREVEDFIYGKTGEGYSKSHLNNIKRSVRYYLDYLGKPEDFFDPKYEKRDDPDHYILSVDEIRAMAEETNSLRDRCIVTVLANTGLRNSELRNLRVKDLDLDEGFLWVKKGEGYSSNKGCRERKVPLRDSCLDLLEIYIELEGLEKTDILFPSKRTGERLNRHSLRNLVKRLGERAEIGVKVYPHLFRYHFATMMGDKVNPKRLQKWLGHRSLETTFRYILKAPGSDRREMEDKGYDYV